MIRQVVHGFNIGRRGCFFPCEEVSWTVMKVLVAPNALKGSLTAIEAAAIIAHSLPNTWIPILCPIADGGDGTLDCLVNATRGKFFNAIVTGPLAFQQIGARWGELGNQKAAVIEMAEASGLRLLTAGEYSAANTTTYGVGELISKALDAGFRKIYIGLGGSATNDGGAGCAQAVGVHLLDRNGAKLGPGGIHLRQLRTIDVSPRDKRIDECDFICLADVQNALTGPSGASRMYALQKGASPAEIELLDDGLGHYAEMIFRQLKVDVARIPGGGAAGGLGAGLIAFCNAEIVSGIDHILELVGFDELLRNCDLVLTAEGSIDNLTLQGKAIAGIAQRAREFNKPVHVFAGRVRGDAEDLCRRLSIHSIHEIAASSVSEDEAVTRAEELLELSVRVFATGSG
jgi:glycerate 2-kinase